MKACLGVLVLLLSGCALNCTTVALSSAWTAVPVSPETQRVRQTAVEANTTDSSGWYGPETWYRDAQNNYFMCTRMDYKACTEYSIFFQHSGTRWVPRIGAESQCRSGS
jgi:hypothetical protein